MSQVLAGIALGILLLVIVLPIGYALWQISLRRKAEADKIAAAKKAAEYEEQLRRKHADEQAALRGKEIERRTEELLKENPVDFINRRFSEKKK